MRRCSPGGKITTVFSGLAGGKHNTITLSGSESPMTVAANDKPSVIRRCPVCKVDRKGRFILANQQTQALFGLTEVELFGKPFVDFVQPADRPAFLQMIRNRNPYETTFDSACLHMIDTKGQVVPATVIVSVNFGGGNPANYQVIIRPDEPTITPGTAQSVESAWQEMTFLLLDEGAELSPGLLASRLHALTGVARVVIHDLNQPECPIVASAGPDDVGVPPLDSAFSSDDAASSGCRVESMPNEVRATFALTDGRPLLVRFVLNCPGTTEVSDTVREHAETAAGLLHSVRTPLQPELSKQTSSQDSISRSQVFDGLGFGFVRLDSRDKVVDHNSAFDAWFPAPDPPTDLRMLLETIARNAGEEEVATIENHLAASARLDESLEYSGNLALNTGVELELNIAEVGKEPGDKSTCFVFRETDERQSKHTRTRGLSFRAGSVALDLLKSSIAATAGVWQKLEHEHHNDLSRDGGFYMSCMSHNVESLAGTIADLERMLKLVGEGEKPQTVDLQLLTNRLTEEITRSFPDRTFAVRHSDLPKISAPLRKLSAVLRDVLLVSVQIESEKALEIAVSASLEDELCTILVWSKGAELSARQIKSLFRLRRRSSKNQSIDQAGLDFGLALAFEVASSLGGSLTAQSRSGIGITFRITLPISHL